MKVAIITGGGSGMGFAVAKRLVAEGWAITVIDLNTTVGQQAAASLGARASFVKADVTNHQDQARAFEETFSRHGHIDFVFANAGIAGEADFYETTAAWPPKAPSLLVQEVNLTGIVYTSHLAMHYMRRNPTPGGIVIMTASAASIYASPDLPLYAAAKHGVLGLMRSMSLALRHENIRVNCTLPGAIQTALHSSDTWSQFDQRSFTPIEDVIDVVFGLITDKDATGRAVEISAGETFDRKQPAFSNETMARIMSGISYE